MYRKKLYVVSAAIVTVVSLMMFSPVMGIAGDLEPGAVPAPTMKTLDQIPPTWSQKLQCDTAACPRFESVLGGAAVLDKETGLVWDQSPAHVAEDRKTWFEAIYYCYNLVLGGVAGWHLPTIEEIASLIDTSIGTNYKVPDPSGQFLRMSATYWSSTGYVGNNTLNSSTVWVVNFTDGSLHNDGVKAYAAFAWCVRGGQAYDTY